MSDLSAPLLVLESLYCERADRVLFEDLSLTVAAGDLVEITGPNGSGKSTLLRIIAGLGQAFSGNFLWQGLPAAQQRQQMHAHTLYIGHSVGVKSNLTVLENLRWSTELKGVFDMQLAEKALLALQLHGYEHSLCATLSAGQQRRVALARLYTCSCTLWVLDEPFTALDKRGIADLQALFEQHRSNGGSIVLTTHQSLDTLSSIKRLQL